MEQTQDGKINPEAFEELSSQMGSLLTLSKTWNDHNHPSDDLTNGWNRDFYSSLYPDLNEDDARGLVALAKIDGDTLLKAIDVGHWLPQRNKSPGNATHYDKVAFSLAEFAQGQPLEKASKRMFREAKDNPVVLNRWESGMPETAKVLGALVAIDSVKVTGQLDDLEEDPNVKSIFAILELPPDKQKQTNAFYNAANS